MSGRLSYHRFAKGKACTEEGCRSAKYYVQDGKRFCQRGHEQINFTQTQQEDENNPNVHGRSTRKVREDRHRTQKALKGRAAVDLYLQCFQLILWKQCHWLVSGKGLAKELETIIRDLWTLRILPLQDSVRIFEEVRSTQGFSSQSEADDSEGSAMSARTSSSHKRIGDDKLPKMVETMGLCYMGMMLLKLPIGVGELTQWAVEGDLVYTRAIKELPHEMRSRLPGFFQVAFELRSVLKGLDVHRAIASLADFFYKHFELALPALNTPLLLFKHVSSLGLPVEIYTAVQNLIKMLNINLRYTSLRKRWAATKTYPEVMLMSLIIVATKLSHPFDNIARCPSSESDPTILKIDWEEWKRLMAREPIEGLKKGQEVNVTDTDVWNMNGKKLDDYLNWYQRVWNEGDECKMPETILELFPLDTLPQQAIGTEDLDSKIRVIKEIHNSLFVQQSISPNLEAAADDLKRPGEFYKRYRTVEDVPENARTFIELAASNCGLDVPTLVRGVFGVELQLESWHLAKRRELVVEPDSLTRTGNSSTDESSYDSSHA